MQSMLEPSSKYPDLQLQSVPISSRNMSDSHIEQSLFNEPKQVLQV
jgi:hypothetical protein